MMEWNIQLYIVVENRINPNEITRPQIGKKSEWYPRFRSIDSTY